MTAILLASWLITQQWAWDRLPTASSYRIYWSDLGTHWCTTDRVEFQAATSCGILAGCPDDLSCCGDIPMPPTDLAFVMITGVNAAGEGPTEHGPVQVCP